MSYIKRTNSGRIVYNRDKHFFSIKRIVTIAEDLTKRLTPDEYRANVFACHALFEVARNAYEPWWLDSIQLSIPETFWREIEPELREAWKDQTEKVCYEVAEAAGVPDEWAEAVIDAIFEHVWDTIWRLTDPLFGGV